MPTAQTQFIHRTSDVGNMKVRSNKNITTLPRTSPIPTDDPSPTGNTHSIISSNTSGIVQLNNRPLKIMDANKTPLENGKILEHVKAKISCITMVPLKRLTRITLVQRFTISRSVKRRNYAYHYI